MKFLILLFVSATLIEGMSRPQIKWAQKPYIQPRAVHKKEARFYEGPVWTYVEILAKQTEGPNYFIPIKVIEVYEKVTDEKAVTLKVLFGESTCPKDGSVPYVDEDSCHLKENGLHAIWKILDVGGAIGSDHDVSMCKVKDLEASEVLTTTRGPGLATFIKRNLTEAELKERDDQDLKMFKLDC